MCVIGWDDFLIWRRGIECEFCGFDFAGGKGYATPFLEFAGFIFSLFPEEMFIIGNNCGMSPAGASKRVGVGNSV